MNDIDESYMREALRIAEHARGRTAPNPLVGAVIVRDDTIIASGWHRAAGEPHAEIHALRMAGELARGATLYVTLEPCAHPGRTGPCAEAVIAAGIARVVIALRDPNPLVAGRGLALLKEAGIEVVTSVCEAEARRQNEVFLKWVTQKRPFVTLKTAMTLDGKIASHTGASQWITGTAARTRVHEYRADQRRVNLLRACGAEVVTLGTEQVDIAALLDYLGTSEITSLLVEGGATVNWSLLAGGCVGKVHAFIAPMLMGGAEAKTPIGGTGFDSPQTALQLRDVTAEQLGADILVTGYPCADAE